MRVGAFAAGLSLALILSGSAFAQTPGCQTVDNAICGSVPATGRLASVRGNVLVGTGAGFTPGVAGRGLVSGNRVVTNNGSAQVNLGPNCTVAVPPQTTRTIGERGALVCLVDGTRPPALPPQAGLDLTPFFVGGALLAGGIIYIQNDKSP